MIAAKVRLFTHPAADAALSCGSGGCRKASGGASKGFRRGAGPEKPLLRRNLYAELLSLFGRSSEDLPKSENRMEQPNWERMCSRVREIAREAAAYIAAERRRFTADKIETKGTFNFVSYVDKGAERILVEALSALLPEAGFVAEEGGGRVDPAAPYQWIVDPLDGTTNFVHGLPPYAVSIALWDSRAREAVVGVVHEVTLDECFYTWRGAEGAFLDGRPIRVSDAARVDDALVLTGLAYGLDPAVVRHFERSFAYFNRHSHGARRLGSAATDLIYVACGRADAFYHINLSPWDVAAGAFIVRQAGGRVADFKGGEDYTFGRSVVAAAPGVWDDIFRLVAGGEFNECDGDRC